MEPGSDPDPGPGPGPRTVRKSPRLSKTSESSAHGNTGRREKLKEVKRRGKMDKSKGEEELIDQLQQLHLSRCLPTGTGLVYTEKFTHHHCIWDPSHPECPDRVTFIMTEVERQGLLSRCVRLEPREATEEELLLVHKRQYVDLMRSTQTMTEKELQTLSENYDSVYIHPESFHVASLAVGSVLQLVDKVMTSDLRNGFSVARPPGHHAHSDKSNGYCLFNNVAIAARYAQRRYAARRVLIVDWDVHHGQGIQYIFQEDPSVLYCSIHRYEQGSFWPHLSDSEGSVVGSGPAAGFNLNLPWNQTGMTDADYLAAFQQLLLPVAYEFQPQLVLVAAGFDSVVGDPKGEMCASPQCFAVLTHMLMSLAQGRIILALEGGYNLASTAGGAAACLRSLLGDPCPTLHPPHTPSYSALQSISETISALYPYWTSLQVLEGGPLAEGDVIRLTANEERAAETNAHAVVMTTGLVYDERMMDHLNLWDSHHPEQPQRIAKIFSKHLDLGLVNRCQRIPVRSATEEELAMCHSKDYIQQMRQTAVMKSRDLHRLGSEFNSVYLNNQSYSAALLAAGGCFSAVHSVVTRQVCNAVSIVRPPGHHAEPSAACGFCLFNTVALCARYAQSLSPKSPLRVLILDWDVHHGNGTQHMFEEDDSVLYISLHRYDNGTFFPSSEDADCDRLGVGRGAGFNVNVPWSGGRMGDSEYLAAFHQIVMPIAAEFRPALVLVSAGFDAARGDPLGGYHVTPEGYAHLTHLLTSLAGGRVVVVLEGGYNLTSISESMAMVTRVLLGDPPPPLASLPPPRPSAINTINQVLRCHAPYWRSLRITIPASLRASLPCPKHSGKRGSKGKGRKWDQQSPDKAALPSPGLEGHSKEDSGLDLLTQGLAGLDISPATSANPTPASTPVGGARQKVRTSTPKSSNEAGAELEPHGVTPEESQSGASAAQAPQPEGATGWSPLSSGTTLELTCGATDGGGTMYVVDPLSWCPHLDSVKPLPPGGVDVFLPCADCSSQDENWICLTCYQVYCGRYVNEHMVLHGMVSEHPIVLSFADLSVWCYTCEAYVHHQILFEAKNQAHCAKFGEEIPPWS